MYDSKNIFEIYQKLSGKLQDISDFMYECDLQKVRNYQDQNECIVKEAYLLISDCVKYTGLNTTKHIWAKADLVQEIDEDDI